MRRRSYRNLGGLYKRCRCARKRWSECLHPWYMAYTFDGEHHRFNLNKRAGKSKRDHVSKTEAETLYARYRTEIREGTFQQPDDVPAGAVGGCPSHDARRGGVSTTSGTSTPRPADDHRRAR